MPITSCDAPADRQRISCGRSQRRSSTPATTRPRGFYAELLGEEPEWKTIYEPWKKFLDDEHQWFRVAEQPFDNYMLSKT